MPARLFLFFLTLFAAAALEAQSVGGPVLGLLFDPAVKGLRPIRGVPGAATLGDALPLPLELSQAAVSPEQNYVLATAGEKHEIVLLRISRGGIALSRGGSQAIRGISPGPDRIVLSPTGSAAALYYRDANRIQVIKGLPHAPAAFADLYISLSPSVLAVSDDGRAVLAGAAGSLVAVTEDGDVPLFSEFHQVSAISFQTRSHNALVADSGSNRVYLVRHVTGNVDRRLLAGPDQDVAGPVAVAASRDNRRAFVANSKTGAVAILNLRGEAAHTVVSCQCVPTGLDPLSGESVFRVTEPSHHPLWLFESGPSESRMVFVPNAAVGERSNAQ